MSHFIRHDHTGDRGTNRDAHRRQEGPEIRLRSPAMGVLLFADLFDEWLGWLVAGLLPEVRAHFGLDYSRAGWALTAHVLGGYLGSAVGGVLADVWDRRRLLLSGAALFALGLAIVGAAPSFAVVLAGCFSLGLASGPVVHTAQLILVDRARGTDERLERFLGRFNALGTVGDLLGPIGLAIGLTAGLGWRGLFGAGALVMATYGLTLATVARISPVRPTAPDTGRPTWPVIVATLADRRLLRVALALALLDGLDEPFAGFVMLFLRDAAGASAALSNAVIVVLAGSPLAGFALAARLTWPRARAMSVSLCALGAGLSGFLLLPGVIAKAAALAVVGSSTAVFYTVALSEALSLRPNTTGTTTSVLSIVGAVSLLFPPLTGAIADKWGLTNGMLLYPALPVVMLLLVRGLGRQPRSTSDPG
jgi:MFS family permease